MAVPDHEVDADQQVEENELKQKLKKDKKDKKDKNDKKKDKKKKSKSKKDEVSKDTTAVKELEESNETAPESDEDGVAGHQDEVMDHNIEHEEDYLDKTSGDERKIFISRIPATFNEDSITQSLNKAFGESAVEHVALTEAKTDEDEGGYPDFNSEARNDPSKEKEHRGFAFVTMSSVEKMNEAIEKGTIKGRAKTNSKRKHTLYIRPIVRQDEGMVDETAKEEFDACFLWKKFRCPYRDGCKFKHIGEGGCVEKKEPLSLEEKKSKQRCFIFRTKGKCKLGDACPYSHDFDPKKSDPDNSNVAKKDSKDKDCINWKTKGKCRKGDKCPYRHDESVREAFLAKMKSKEDKKRSRDQKTPQPLSVRVFGLNYDTTEADVREYFKDCGIIKEIMFPIYEDSGRSKGYCGILFVSPKATEKACALDGQELHGRWLSVQPGKMYLKQWEQREQDRKDGNDGEDKVGEFGQKVKKRKTHGFKED
jgi:hypothetical protein